MITRRRIGKWLLLFGALLCTNSCYKEFAGCLDIFANNFQANADFECEDCCVYPSITLDFSYRADSNSFSFSDTLYNQLDSFKIINAGFYLYDVKVLTSDTPITVRETDSFWFSKSGSSVQESVPTDIAAVSPVNGRSYNLGTHNRQTETLGLSFEVGLPSDLNDLIQDSIPTSSDLLGESNPLYNATDGYATAFMQIVSDFTTGDTVLYQLPIANLSHTITLDTSVYVDFGQNISVPIEVDFLAWTTGIDFEANSTMIETIRESFVNNIPNSISLNQ